MPEYKEIKALCKLMTQLDGTMKTALSGQTGEVAQLRQQKAEEGSWVTQMVKQEQARLTAE